ncbi:MAG TPA: creatininase family protein [Vicinamibacterales bacterium]
MKHIAITIVLALPVVIGAQARPQMTPEQRAAQAKQRYDAELAKPRPIPAHDSVWLEELTYLEARDAIRGGKTTALVFAGSTEQNGPYLPGAKHQIALRLVGESIARKLGNALIAPIIPMEAGNPDNPYMNWGSLYLSRDTFQAVLRDVATSLKSQGFTHIILMGDSGGDVAGLRAVAQELSAKWAGAPAVHHVPEFYNWGTPGGVRDFITRNGIDEKFDSDGIHDEYAITAVMMLADPKHVRLEQRVAAGKATINGVDILPKEKTIEMGRNIVEFRADTAVAAIRKVVGR